MAKAEAKIPWVMSREGVARVARHLGCAPEDAELRISGKAKAGSDQGARRYLRGLSGLAASRQLAQDRLGRWIAAFV